jgi:hypothetical protein
VPPFVLGQETTKIPEQQQQQQQQHKSQLAWGASNHFNLPPVHSTSALYLHNYHYDTTLTGQTPRLE